VAIVEEEIVVMVGMRDMLFMKVLVLWQIVKIILMEMLAIVYVMKVMLIKTWVVSDWRR